MLDLFDDGLFDKLVSWDNILLAYAKAKKGKKGRVDVLEFARSSSFKLAEIQKELMNKTYRPGVYYTFTVHDSKKRVIQSAPFEDRIVHHSLCNVIEPIFEKSFIFDSYACRKGKGAHKAIMRLQGFVNSLMISGGG